MSRKTQDGLKMRLYEGCILDDMTELLDQNFWANNPNLSQFVTDRMFEKVRGDVEKMPAKEVDMFAISRLLTERGLDAKFFYSLVDAWASSIR